jgi:CheY-like chemotaxis protein
VAEDHKINRKLCLAMLKELGVIADTAANGFEILAAMEKKTYDLILMDCHMPEMDGYQATAAIRQLETYSQGHRVRIVALTANALNGERERCLEAGMDDYLTKPFRLGQLRHFLSMALAASQADLEVLNPARLNQLCHELDARFVPEIVSDFARDLPENVAELKQCIESGNWAETERIAHSLKGVGASFGLDLLAAKFQVVERAAADKDAGTAVRLQDEFEPLAKLSADALRRWLQTAGSSM